MGVLRQKKVKEEGTGGRRWGNASESKTAKQVSKGRAALMAEGACMPAMHSFVRDGTSSTYSWGVGVYLLWVGDFPFPP